MITLYDKAGKPVEFHHMIDAKDALGMGIVSKVNPVETKKEPDAEVKESSSSKSVDHKSRNAKASIDEIPEVLVEEEPIKTSGRLRK